MTHSIEASEANIKTQHLSGRQKLMFGLICWGVNAWSKAKGYRNNGYDQKYKDATHSMYTGLMVYGIAILLFVLWVFFA